MGNIEFIPIQLEHASGKSMWLLKNCTSISVSNAISSVFNLQLIAKSSRMAPANHPPLVFSQRLFFVKRNPVSTLASLSTSRLIFVGKVSMLRGCERWRRKAKPRDQRPPQGHRSYKLVRHTFLSQEKRCLPCCLGSMKSMKPRYLYICIYICSV